MRRLWRGLEEDKRNKELNEINPKQEAKEAQAEIDYQNSIVQRAKEMLARDVGTMEGIADAVQSALKDFQEKIKQAIARQQNQSKSK